MAFPWSAGDQLDADDLNAILSVTDEAADTECFPIFVTAATGNLNHKSNAALKFNAATGLLEATFIGGDGRNLTAIYWDAIASDNVKYSANTERSTNSGSPVQLKEMKVNFNGVVRLNMEIKNNGGSGSTAILIYKNGVLVTTYGMDSSYNNNYTAISPYNLTVNRQDLVQICGSGNGTTYYAYVKNFTMSYDKSYIADGVVNTD